MIDTTTVSIHDEYPPQADLRKMMDQNPLPVIAPGTIDSDALAGDEPTKQALSVLDKLNNALAADDPRALESLFFTSQAFWKDTLALTYHLRTFNKPATITANLLETKRMRGLTKGIRLDGSARFMPAAPTLVRIPPESSPHWQK